MKILVVENEKPAAEKLCRFLHKIDEGITILDTLETVEQTINWLQENPNPDLMLMDIQLDDGLCFEIFETIQLKIPVIFTTAYDEYTLKAFKVNSVDNLLKPLEEEDLKKALEKFKYIHYNKSATSIDLTKIIEGYSHNYKSRFLVTIGAKYKSIPVSDVTFFHIAERNTFLRAVNGQDYGIDFSLDQLHQLLDPGKFYRINRNCIVHIHAITEMVSYSSSRLQLVLQNEPKSDAFVVSRDKVADFKRWVDR